jgi:hypothetical protein
MLKRFQIYSVIVISALMFGGYISFPAISVSQESKPVEGKTDKDKCLACHGPYDKLIQNSVKFKTPEGETVMTHQYVPHKEKKDIPECSECHKPHAIPLEDKSSVIKPTEVKWCYTKCHHQNNFQLCESCH